MSSAPTGGSDRTAPGIEPGGVLAELVHATHFLEPDGLPELVRRTAVALGASDARILLVDHEQRELRHLVDPHRGADDPLLIDGTVAGRVFQALQTVEIPDDDAPDGARRLLTPLLNGTDRLGVLELRLSGPSPAEELVTLFASLVADLVVTKSSYGDTIEITRRRRPMAVRAEAQRALLPPLTFMSSRLVVTAMLEPSLEVAGDVFDYAVNDDTLHVAILDAMGHSLSATLIATVATAAYRNARRAGATLQEAWELADRAVAREFDGDRFATALFVELDLAHGVVRSVSAGHPTALVVRGNRVMGREADEPTLPLGLGGEPPAITTRQLQPGDRLLLFTDGIVEARAPDGTFFGEERLVEQLARALDSGLPAPEAVRRLIGTVVAHQDHSLRDDATLVLVEWRGDAEG